MKKVIVGIDGSKGSRRALEWAVQEARMRGATLDVIYAWHYPYFAAMPTGAAIIDSEMLQEAADRIVEDALAEVDTTDVVVERHVVGGPAAMVLVDRSADADLVVVGSRGRGGFAGLVLGSISQQVASHAHCPVTIVRGEPD
jgi:nucleotide-binding universal stress UspA family protein